MKYNERHLTQRLYIPRRAGLHFFLILSCFTNTAAPITMGTILVDMYIERYQNQMVAGRFFGKAKACP